MNDRLDLSRLVEETLDYAKANLQLLLPLAGAFFFLPSVLTSRMLPDEVASFDSISGTLVLALLIVFVIQTIGQLAILGLMLLPGSLTVRQCLELAVRRLGLAIGVQFLMFAVICLTFIVAQVLVLLLFSGGAGESASVRAAGQAMLVASPFIIYLLARFFIAYPLVVAEKASPFMALRQAFMSTAKVGWKLAAFIIGGGMTYLFLQLVLGSAIRVTFQMIGKAIGLQGLGVLLADAGTSLLGAVASVFFTIAMGIAYRQISAR